jgi:hypothetical protein
MHAPESDHPLPHGDSQQTFAANVLLILEAPLCYDAKLLLHASMHFPLQATPRKNLPDVLVVDLSKRIQSLCPPDAACVQDGHSCSTEKTCNGQHGPALRLAGLHFQTRLTGTYDASSNL